MVFSTENSLSASSTNSGCSPLYASSGLARLEKLQELSEDYNNFTMLNDGNKGNVKFIMIMDSIKKEEDSKQDIILDDKHK